EGIADRTDDLSSAVRLVEPRQVPCTRASDLAGWFGIGQKPTVISATGAKPSSAVVPVTVGLGFDPKDTPIAFVEVHGEGQPPGLRSPAWQPVTLNSAGRLKITVHYTTGDPAYDNEVDAPSGERKLTRVELGVVDVTVDASARKTAGAKQLEVT